MLRVCCLMASVVLCLVGIAPGTVSAGEAARHEVLEAGQQPEDRRLKPPKDLNGYFPFEVPETVADWKLRQAELKQRVQVATGLWPLPERTPLNAVIHGKVERDGFTAEKVYFESLPGHFVTGMLFRPADSDGKPGPAVLSPHGHGGRLQKATEDKIAKQIANGEEFLPNSGRMPKLARCAQLAKMGCVTFIYDMLGYADSRQITYETAHRYKVPREGLENDTNWGFYAPQAEARLHSIMSLQTWNSIRALDFLESLPDVDPQRLAVTGGSGGGTQTILLGALDDRQIVGYPNGMVSTSMQGGCTCENCSLLRIGTGNVELAALFAPRPQAMTAANDWTKAMMTKGYPQLKQLYTMLGVPENVDCVEMLHFPHNYNSVTRGLMYSWMNRHLQLGLEEPIVETDWELFSEEESAVWNSDHPAPPAGMEYEQKLLKQLDERDRQVLFNHDPQTIPQIQEYRRLVSAGWQTILGRGLPQAGDIQRTKVWKEERSDYLEFGDLITLTSAGEQLPVVSLYPQGTDWNSKVVLWVDGDGKSGLFTDSGLQPDVQSLVNAGYAVVGVDLFGQGEFSTNRETQTENRRVKNPRTYAGYTYTYNNTLFVQRVHDVLTAVAWITGDEHSPEALYAVGVNGAGPIVAAARAVAGSTITKAAVVSDGFRFDGLDSWQNAQFVPGAVKYGDLPTLLGLSAPHPLWVGGEDKLPKIVQTLFDDRHAADRVTVGGASGNAVSEAVRWLMQ